MPIGHGGRALGAAADGPACGPGGKPGSRICPQEQASLGRADPRRAHPCASGQRLRLAAREEAPAISDVGGGGPWVCAVLRLAGARHPRGPAEPSARAGAWRRGACPRGPSLVPVFPDGAASSRPLGGLFLTGLCISCMRKTSTSVLVCFTGKCCNCAQLRDSEAAGGRGPVLPPPPRGPARTHQARPRSGASAGRSFCGVNTLLPRAPGLARPPAAWAGGHGLPLRAGLATTCQGPGQGTGGLSPSPVPGQTPGSEQKRHGLGAWSRSGPWGSRCCSWPRPQHPPRRTLVPPLWGHAGRPGTEGPGVACRTNPLEGLATPWVASTPLLRPGPWSCPLTESFPRRHRPTW